MHLYASSLALHKQQKHIHKNHGWSLMLFGDLCWFLKPPPHQRTNLASPLPRGFLGQSVWGRDGSKTSSFLAHCHQRMDRMKAVLVCRFGFKREIDVTHLYLLVLIYSYSWFLLFAHKMLTCHPGISWSWLNPLNYQSVLTQRYAFKHLIETPFKFSNHALLKNWTSQPAITPRNTSRLNILIFPPTW